MQFKNKFIPVAIALAFAGSAYAQDTIKIGHVAPVSGPNSHLGKDMENGARMAVEDLSAKGVKIGGKPVKFVVQFEDDAGDPKQGTTAAQKLVDAKVQGVIGHLNSGTTIPASKIYYDAGIPQISLPPLRRCTPSRSSIPPSAWSPTTTSWAAPSAPTP